MLISRIGMKYRSRTDITAQILEAANGGVTKTKIMYKAFLSYAQLKEYLAVLIENGLLEYIEGEQIYRTTEKGNRFLKIYNQIGEITKITESESCLKSGEQPSGG
jgi:predicted transcriptional regulator